MRDLLLERLMLHHGDNSPEELQAAIDALTELEIRFRVSDEGFAVMRELMEKVRRLRRLH